MKKIRLMGLAFIVIVSIIATASTKKEKLAQQKPNIIYIYVDDLGYGDIEPYGQKYIKTPNLVKLANEGIKFTQHYTGAPICAPARCILMTGKHSGNAYIRNNYELKDPDPLKTGQMPLPAEEETIAEMLKRAGYQTAIIGKWGLGSLSSSGAPNKQGFDFFYGYADQVHAHNHYPAYIWRNSKMETLKNDSFHVHQRLESGVDPNNASAYDKFKGTEHTLDLMTKEANQFIKRNSKTPFFLYLAYVVPHKALQVPDESLEMYDNVFEEEPYLGGKGYSPHRRPLSAYAAMITRMDAKIGEIVKTLQDLGIDKNTMVMFSSDNGPASGGGLDPEFFNSSGGLRGSKGQVYEGGIRVPFIVYWPGKTPEGKVTNHISAQYDLMATIADVTGLQPKYTDGISFLPTILGRDKNQQKHDYLYWEFSNMGGQYAIRMGDWKGVKKNIARDMAAKWEVYNLKEDVTESNNVADLHPDLIKKFEEIVNKRTPSHNPQWNFVGNQ